MLWLATSIIHHANKVRSDRVRGEGRRSPGVVGVDGEHHDGAVLRAPARSDRVSVKPHASPVLHAIDYLLGALDERYLTELRAYGGLQSYPSRLRTRTRSISRPGRSGSAPRPRYGAPSPSVMSSAHFDVPRGGRRVALVGDAELDEGPVWEALVDPIVPAPGRGPLDRRPEPPVTGPGRPGHRRRPYRRPCSTPRGGTRSPSSTALGCASCSRATDGELLRGGSTR